MGKRSLSVLTAALALSWGFGGCSSSSEDKARERPDAEVPPEKDGGGPGDAVVPACGSEDTPTCPSVRPSYKNDIAPIMKAECNGCHVGGPTGPWPLEPYEDLSHWKTLLLGSMLQCTMPPEDAGHPLAAADRAAIIGWVACGAPNN